MQALVIEGMHPLRGSVPVHGSKNGALPLLAAALLAPGRTVLHHCPRLTDVQTTMEILRHLGAGCGWEGGTLWVDASAVTGTAIPEELMRRQRASVLFLGALLARCGEATLSTPGGCALGERPVDLHLSLLRQLGAEVGQQGDRIFCRGAALPGGEAYLSYPSVGATENFLLAAQGCAGPSRLLGAAMEPEIGELAELLCAMGARIEGVGTPVLTVYPAGALRSTEHTVRADRIEAATLLCAAVSAGGAVELTGVEPSTLQPVLDVLWQTGSEIRCTDTSVRLRAPERPRAPERVVTAPWPGFPTDAQAPLMAALLRCCGTTQIREQVFQSRFHHVPELRRMGAVIETDGPLATITGVLSLRGTHLQGCELRGTAALAVAALGAEGESVVTGLEFLDRGYENIKNLLSELGAAIKRVEISPDVVYNKIP